MTTLCFEPFFDPGVLHVCRNMRTTDAAEVFATRPDMDSWALYRDLAAAQPAHLWFELVRPVAELWPFALFGVIATSPGVGIAHLIATPDMSLADARVISARIREKVIPTMIDAGMHRVEAMSLASYGWAHRFLKSAGARAEGPPRKQLGKAGEDFQCFVWLRDELTALKPSKGDTHG